MRSKRLLIAVAVAVVVLLGATGLWLRFGTGGSSDPQAAAQTSFPDLTPATGEPTLPSLVELRPAPGSVVQAAGPFDDRFDLTGLVFDGRTVKGTATITSDVSELLEFEAQAGFYDRDGALIGTARHSHHLGAHTHDESEEGTPELAEEFSIEVPEPLRGTAVAAAVGVPVLVNE